MRALLSQLRRDLPSARLGRLRAPLRWLARLLGDVRDLDVLLADRIEPLLERRSGDAGLARLRAEAVALREEHRVALRKALRSRRHVHLMLELGCWIASLEELDLADPERAPVLAGRTDAFAERVLGRLDRRARKRAAAALDGPPEVRHALRIALKRLRYGGEFFRSLYAPKETRRFLRRLARLQDLLGTANDVDVAGRLLAQLLDRCPADQAIELARAAGFVEGFAAREQAGMLRKLPRRWARFEAERAFWRPE